MEEMEEDEQRRGETGAVIGNASMIGREDEQRWMAFGFDPSTRANFRSLEQARVDRRPGPLAVRETQRKPSASGMRCGLDGKLSRLTRATGAGIVWRRAEILLLQPATSTRPSQMGPVASTLSMGWMLGGSAGQDWIERNPGPVFWCGGLNCQIKAAGSKRVRVRVRVRARVRGRECKVQAHCKAQAQYLYSSAVQYRTAQYPSPCTERARLLEGSHALSLAVLRTAQY
ncbi:hypothetical protein J3F84DRAFT_232766 [Trichoderma pleuroticola]